MRQANGKINVGLHGGSGRSSIVDAETFDNSVNVGLLTKTDGVLLEVSGDTHTQKLVDWSELDDFEILSKLVL